MTPAHVLGYAVLATLVVVLATLLLARRSRGGDHRVVATLGGALTAPLEARVRELEQALEVAEGENRRYRAFAELAVSIELDDVVERTLEAARIAAAAEAALLILPDVEHGRPLVATVGLSAEEAERQGIVAGPPDGRSSRAVSIGYAYTDEQRGRNHGLIHSGVALPLGIGEAEIGRVAVFTRDPQRSFGDSDVRELEELARRAAPALENALRFRKARELADLDALTGLHNRRYFHETLEREVARAQRYARDLSLVVMDLDDFKKINDRIGHLGGDAVLAEAAARIRSVVRTADVACRVGGDEFAIILPEFSLRDAQHFYDRVREAVSSRPIGDIPQLLVSAGVAELQKGDDPRSLFERADEALYEAKGSRIGVAAPARSA